MSRHMSWGPAVWTDEPLSRIRFVHDLRMSGVHARVVHPAGQRRAAFVVAVRIAALELPEHHVRITFARGADVPRVHVDGPSTSPHRYGDGSLCMWHPDDPANCRWTRADGARALLGHILAHLVREHWWRMTGHWPGDEAPHGSPGQTAHLRRGAA